MLNPHDSQIRQLIVQRLNFFIENGHKIIMYLMIFYNQRDLGRYHRSTKRPEDTNCDIKTNQPIFTSVEILTEKF